MKWILLLIIIFLDLTIAFTQNTMVVAHKKSKLNLIEVYQYPSLNHLVEVLTISDNQHFEIDTTFSNDTFYKVKIYGLIDGYVKRNEVQLEKYINSVDPEFFNDKINFLKVNEPINRMLIEKESNTLMVPDKFNEVIYIEDYEVELAEVLDIEDAELEEDIEVDFSYLAMDEAAAEDTPVFFIVEEMPEFPGGEDALRKFITKSVRYPVIAQEKGIQGRVYVSFVVNTKGKVSDIKIARGVDPNLDKEAIRVVNSMPVWKPGKQRGKKVKVSYTVPVNFVLQ